ncbi:MAG: hypothetical protein LUC98_01395 [Lachnospiraceae bacterium]|nr:hypothetical protein [Lachnospiraceae bacterium]
MVNASLETIYRHMEGMKAYWTGSASDTHWGIYASLNSTVQTILNSYAEHVKDLEVMAGVYDAAEETATEQAESMPASTLQ